MDVTLVRPKDTPIATGFADTDKFFIDSDIGIRNFTGAQLKTTLATAFVAAPATFSLATLGVDGKVPTSQLPTTLTGALVYKGTVAGASVAATSTAAGDYYVITSAGTSQSKTWAVGDVAIYKGTSGQWDQLTAGVTQIAQGGTGATTAAAARTALGVFSQSEVSGRIQTLRGGVVLDGASGKVISGPMPVLGTGDFSVEIGARVPATNPTSPVVLWASGSPTGHYVTGGFEIYIETSGKLYVLIEGATPGADLIRSYVSGFVAAWAGQEVKVAFTRASNTVNLYVNGALQTLVPDDAGSVGSGWASALTGSYSFVGNNGPSSSNTYTSRIHSLVVLNFALTAPEAADLAVFGLAHSMRWASPTPLVMPNAGFESDPVGYAISTVTTASGGAYGATEMWRGAGNHVGTVVSDSAVEGSKALEIVASAAGSASTGENNIQRDRPRHVIGKRYRWSFWAKTVSGNTALSAGAGGGDGLIAGTLTGSWQKFSVEYSASSLGSTLRIAIGGAGTFRIDDVRFEQLGALQDINLAVGFGCIFPDRSPNCYHMVGSNGGWTHLNPVTPTETLNYSEVISRDAMIGGGVIGDGSASKGLEGYAPALGSGDITIIQRVRIPAAVQSGLYPTLCAIREDANNYLWMYIATGLKISLNAAKSGVSVSNAIQFDATPFAGKTVELAWKRTGTTITLLVNEAVAGQATNAVYDVSFSAAARIYVLGYGTNNSTACYTAGMYRHGVFNFALGPADFAEVAEHGLTQKYRYGSVAALYQAASFATADSWAYTVSGLTLTAAYTDPGGQANTLRVVNTSAGGAGVGHRMDIQRNVAGVAIGRRYRFSATIYNENIQNAFFTVSAGGYAPVAGSIAGSYIAPGTVGVVTGLFDSMDTGTPSNVRIGCAIQPEGAQIYAYWPDNAAYALRALTITAPGAVQASDLSVGAGFFFPDLSGNGLYLEGTPVGWQHKARRTAGEFTVVKMLQHSDISATAETTLLFNLPANVGVIDIEFDRETAFDSGITLRVGPTGANTKYVNDQAVNATGKVLVTPYTGGGASEGASSYFPIWIKKSGATTQGATTVRVRCAVRG